MPYKPQIKTDLGVEDLDLVAERAEKDGDGNVIANTYLSNIKINGVALVKSNKEVNIITLSAYDATSNKLATVKDTLSALMSLSSVAGNATSGSELSVRWYVSNVNGITAPYDGMRIAIKVPLAGVATAGVVLSINGNDSQQYHPVAYNINTVLTSHYAKNCIKVFVYDANATMTCYLSSGTAVSITGVWKAEADYNTNSTSYLSYTAGAVSSGTTKNYIIGKPTVASNGTNKYNANVYFTNEGTLNAPSLSEGGTELEEKYVLQTQTFLNNDDGKDIMCNIHYSSSGIQIGIDAKTTGSEYWQANRSSIGFYYDGVYIISPYLDITPQLFRYDGATDASAQGIQFSGKNFTWNGNEVAVKTDIPMPTISDLTTTKTLSTSLEGTNNLVGKWFKIEGRLIIKVVAGSATSYTSAQTFSYGYICVSNCIFKFNSFTYNSSGATISASVLYIESVCNSEASLGLPSKSCSASSTNSYKKTVSVEITYIGKLIELE